LLKIAKNTLPKNGFTNSPNTVAFSFLVFFAVKKKIVSKSKASVNFLVFSFFAQKKTAKSKSTNLSPFPALIPFVFVQLSDNNFFLLNKKPKKGFAAYQKHALHAFYVFFALNLYHKKHALNAKNKVFFKLYALNAKKTNVLYY